MGPSLPGDEPSRPKQPPQPEATGLEATGLEKALAVDDLPHDLVKVLQAIRSNGDTFEQLQNLIREFENNIEAGAAKEPSGLSRESMADLLRRTHFALTKPQAGYDACYLGPEHSYSHLAALKYFGDQSRLSPVASIPAVFDAVSQGDAPRGIVPIENSTDGRVVDTLSQLIEGGTRIIGEIRLPIHHCLLASSQPSEIDEIQSKPQALSQCRGYLARHFPRARLSPVASTAAAAKEASRNPKVAAVASQQAGAALGLRLIAADIEDNQENITRFVILGKELPPPSGDDKTSLLFQVHHKPGSLAEAMMVMKRHGLNVTFIESFPSPGQRDQYQFFVEWLGHASEEAVAAALESLEDLTQRLIVLGSYRRAAEN